MNPSEFTRRLQVQCLYHRRVGKDATADLATLRQRPEPINPDRAKRAANTIMKNIGPLVANGLAVFNRDAGHYEITPKGREWLDKIRAARMLDWLDSEAA